MENCFNGFYMTRRINNPPGLAGTNCNMKRLQKRKKEFVEVYISPMLKHAINGFESCTYEVDGMWESVVVTCSGHKYIIDVTEDDNALDIAYNVANDCRRFFHTGGN